MSQNGVLNNLTVKATMEGTNMVNNTREIGGVQVSYGAAAPIRELKEWQRPANEVKKVRLIYGQPIPQDHPEYEEYATSHTVLNEFVDSFIEFSIKAAEGMVRPLVTAEVLSLEGPREQRLGRPLKFRQGFNRNQNQDEGTEPNTNGNRYNNRYNRSNTWTR